MDATVLAQTEPDLEPRVRAMLNRHPAVGLAVGVVRDGALQWFSGHGVADIVTGAPVTENTVFRVASITKTFTAVAAMQLVEQGLVDLDAPVEEYLRAYRLVPRRSGWRPATLRHLLTHTAGIGEEAPRSRAFRRDFGESFPVGRAPSLAEFYGGALRLDAEPGTRFRYSDHGPATAGQLVEDVSGEPFDRYLREHVFGLLGMADTDVVLSEPMRARLATGYRLGKRGPRPVPERQWVTTGASSAYSTPADMARYVVALLGGGTNEHGSVLRPQTLASMFEPHYRGDPRLPGVGLTFFRAELGGGHRAVEHQGILPGFDSQIFAAPDDGVGVMAFTNGAHQGSFWLPTEMSRVLRQLLDVPDPRIPADVPQHPEFWRELCGWYYLAGPLTDVRVRGFMGAGVEIYAHGDELRLRFLTPIPALYRGFVLHPDDASDPYSFRMDLFGTGEEGMRLVFGRDPAAAHVDLMPVSLVKQPESTNPRRWATGALAAVGTAAVLRRARRDPARGGRGRVE